VNYVSEELAMWLTESGITSCACKATVCGAFGKCTNIQKCFAFDLILINELTNVNFKLIAMKARVITTDYDVIIGLPTIWI